MNDLSNELAIEKNTNIFINNNNTPIPTVVIYILLLLFITGLSVSTFILVAVHNFTFFLLFLVVSGFVGSLVIWNVVSFRRKVAAFRFLHSFPDSDLLHARDGQLVKITGMAACGSASMNSSYERATGCIYTSTLLYEHGGVKLKPTKSCTSCFRWSLTYCERFSKDFYLTDRKTGITAIVKAGSGCKVFPLITESKLVTTTRKCRVLSPYLRKWLQERNLSTESRLLRLEEGYVQEGSFVTVLGVLHKRSDILMIVQPQEVVSTGCMWRKLLLSVDIDGLIIGVPLGNLGRQ